MAITLYTSIHPSVRRRLADQEVGEVYLDECLASWRNVGFDIASLNRPEEIDALARRYPFVVFHPTESKRPRISEFVSLIGQDANGVAGIFNSDCIYFGAKNASEVEQEAAGGLLLYERLNFSSAELIPTGSCFGFDAFIFSTVHSARSIDCNIMMGQTWWDYMFPLAYLEAGGRIVSVETCLLHLDHPLGWDNEQYLEGARRTLDLFGERVGADVSVRDQDALYQFAFRCFDYLRQHGKDERDTPVRERMVRALHQQTMNLKKTLAEISRRQDEAAAEMNAAWARRLEGPGNRWLGELLCTVARPFRTYGPTRRFAETVFSLGDDLQLRASQGKSSIK